MLQRIQSIYLFFAALVIFGLFVFPLTHTVFINGEPSVVKISGIYSVTSGQQTLVLAFNMLKTATVILGIIPLIIIFLYKNRKQQAALCYLAVLIVIGVSFWVARVVKGSIGGQETSFSSMGIGVYLFPIAIILLLIAAKSIRRDEQLVRSAERLREAGLMHRKRAAI